jgi:hypothetical protein
MANTNCTGCIFAHAGSPIDNFCEFDIPYHVKDIKNISVKDDFYYIENYRCKYAFSEKVLSDNNLDKNSIKNILIKQSHISYYLIINARNLHSIDDFIKLGEQINNLDISPKLVSILVDIYNTDNKVIFQTLYNTIVKNIKWKLHAFLNDISFNEAANVAAETNIQGSECSLIYFWDIETSDCIITNDRINHVFFVRNIQQNNIVGFRSSMFDGLCIPIPLYKSIITLIDRDILKALTSITDFSLSSYDEK